MLLSICLSGGIPDTVAAGKIILRDWNRFVLLTFPCSIAEKKFDVLLLLNNWFVVSVCPSSYGCLREVAEHERSVTVAGGDSRVPL